MEGGRHPREEPAWRGGGEKKRLAALIGRPPTPSHAFSPPPPPTRHQQPPTQASGCHSPGSEVGGAGGSPALKEAKPGGGKENAGSPLGFVQSGV